MNILVFTQHAFPLSATFIYRQVVGAREGNRLSVAALKFSNENVYPLSEVGRVQVRAWYGLADRIRFYIQRRIFGKRTRLSSVAINRLRLYLEENHINLVHVHYGTWAVALLELMRSTNVPFVVSFHGHDASRALRDKQYVNALPGLFDCAAAIVIVSEHMRDTLNLKAWYRKVHLIPYGIDCEFFRRSGVRGRSRGMKILHAGRLTGKKGVPDLIRVFARMVQHFPETTLHILGDGEEMALCRALIIEYSLHDSVILYGAKPVTEVVRLMNACDIFVLNSRTSATGDMEGLPNAILEAMSMEMAVVSTRHAGIPTVINDDAVGFLVDEQDLIGLERALGRFLQDPQLVCETGKRARARIMEHFTNEHMGGQLKTLYEKFGQGATEPVAR